MTKAGNRIFKAVRTKQYMDNGSLSWGAKGMLAYIFSRADGWKFSVNDLCEASREAETACRAIIKELRGAGYIRYLGRVALDEGRGAKSVWEVRENPSNLGENDAHVVGGGGIVSSEPSHVGFDYEVAENSSHVENQDGVVSDCEVSHPDFPNEVTGVKGLIKRSIKGLEVKDLNNTKPEEQELPLPPGAGGGWPIDVRPLAVAFARKFGREAFKSEKSYWIKIIREKYLASGITIQELESAYDKCKDISIKSPDSIFFKVDELHRAPVIAPMIIGPTVDGGTLVQYPNGVFGTVYGD